MKGGVEIDIQFYLNDGYVIENQTETNYILVKKEKQSGLVHALLFFFTAGLGNIIYYFSKANKKKQLVIPK